jgi:hypothetical protein
MVRVSRIDLSPFKELVLPDLENRGRMLWPPPKVPLAAHFAVVADAHPGAGWSDPQYREAVRQERAAEQRKLRILSAATRGAGGAPQC